MTWRYDRSEERVKAHLKNMGEIEVEPLVREMDLENLSETICRHSSLIGCRSVSEMGWFRVTRGHSSSTVAR